VASAQDALKPGDILAVRSPGLAGELIRIGEELTGKPGLENHVAVCHHYDSAGTPWGIEGRPGGIGWVDLRAYLADAYTVNNVGQPGRDDRGRAQVATLAQHMLGTAYDWCAIADDTLRAFHMPELFSKTLNGTVPAHLVCSSFTDFLYERAGWDHPSVPDRDCEPADWVSFILEHGYDMKLEAA
jgi:hypothetical protein